MKKRYRAIKVISFLALALILLPPLGAQTRLLGLFTYDVSVPFGSVKAFTKANRSWRGISGQVRVFLKPSLSLGLYSGLQVFHGVTAETIAIDLKDTYQGAITGKQFRYANCVPIMLGLHYYTAKDYQTQAFFGLNAGAIAIEEKVAIGLFSLKDLRWHFGFAPEIGVTIPLGYNASITVDLKYNYAFGASRAFSGSTPAYSYLSLSIGLGYNYFLF
jgi:hypothetical protein